VGEVDGSRDLSLRSVGRRWDIRWEKVKAALADFIVDEWGDA
jgi:hypothetical protein